MTLARLWGVSPKDLRDCTYEEIRTMWAVIEKEQEHGR